MPILFLSSSDDVMLSYLIGIFLDCITFFPLAIIVLLNMLQDRRRPLWPIVVMVVPLAAVMGWSIASSSDTFLPFIRVYLMLLGIGIIIYMVCAVRQYGRWLRDNYADLEHKEVWQSFVIMAIIFLAFGVYAIADLGPFYRWFFQLNIIALICYLLWRVETLSDLSIPVDDTEDLLRPADSKPAELERPHSLANNIEPLLKHYCEESQLYLQHDLTLLQLAKIIGINRSYLSKYFALQGITYNAYINGLRIQHFINLYHEAVATHQPIIVQQLAYQSGFRSYSTFYAAFKQSTGMSATEWMRNNKAE